MQFLTRATRSLAARDVSSNRCFLFLTLRSPLRNAIIAEALPTIPIVYTTITTKLNILLFEDPGTGTALVEFSTELNSVVMSGVFSKSSNVANVLTSILIYFFYALEERFHVFNCIEMRLFFVVVVGSRIASSVAYTL